MCIDALLCVSYRSSQSPQLDLEKFFEEIQLDVIYHNDSRPPATHSPQKKDVSSSRYGSCRSYCFHVLKSTVVIIVITIDSNFEVYYETTGGMPYIDHINTHPWILSIHSTVVSYPCKQTALSSNDSFCVKIDVSNVTLNSILYAL